MLMGSDLPFQAAVRDHRDALRDPHRTTYAATTEARPRRSEPPRDIGPIRAGARRPAHA